MNFKNYVEQEKPDKSVFCMITFINILESVVDFKTMVAEFQEGH